MRWSTNGYGELPWADLFEPALRLARDGFVVSPRLANYLPFMAERTRLAVNPGTKDYFYPDGQPLQAGQLLKNPEYAQTLERLASEGADAFYTGDIAEAIVAATRLAPRPGTLTLADLAGYQAVERPVICGPFRELKICTTTPPSSGGRTNHDRESLRSPTAQGANPNGSRSSVCGRATTGLCRS